jgi:homoserine O-acetyltransferase
MTTAHVDYAAAAPLRQGLEGSQSIGSFHFESGDCLDDLRVGYVTHGQLDPEASNAVLLLPGTANTRHSADGYIGAGLALDPDREFIIAVDAIGAGTSSQPADGLRSAFPRYSIRDMVHAQYRLITDHFGLRGLKAVIGASMGAFQALEWAIHYPSMMRRAVLLVPAARSGEVFRGVVDTALSAIRLDPAWNDGDYQRSPEGGLRMAGRIYYPWTVTDRWIEQSAPAVIERERHDTVERAAGWDAWNFIRRYEASAVHDVATPFGGDLGLALGQVQARTLVMPSSSDRLLPVAGARVLASMVRHAHYLEIPSLRGHLGWRAVRGAPETRFINEAVRRFLDQGAP